MLQNVHASFGEEHVKVYLWNKSFDEKRPWLNLCFRNFTITLHMPGNARAFAESLMTPTYELHEWVQAPDWNVRLVHPDCVFVKCAGINLTLSQGQAQDFGKEILRHI